jgi:hypothetical protein
MRNNELEKSIELGNFKAFQNVYQKLLIKARCSKGDALRTVFAIHNTITEGASARILGEDWVNPNHLIITEHMFNLFLIRKSQSQQK